MQSTYMYEIYHVTYGADAITFTAIRRAAFLMPTAANKFDGGILGSAFPIPRHVKSM